MTSNSRYKFIAKGPARAELLIYGDIGEDPFAEVSNDAKTVVGQINAAQSAHLDVRINSYGGSVADGLAIRNALKRHPGGVTTHIDGVAFSIASLIAMGGQRVKMASNAMLMIHAPWGASVGNARDMRGMADMLDATAEAMAAGYRRDNGPPALSIEEWLTDGEDHYFGADRALELGLVDEITDAIDSAAALRGAHRFTPPAATGNPSPTTEDAMSEHETTTGGAPASSDTAAYLEQHKKAVAAGTEKGAKAENARIRDIHAAFDGFVTGDDPTDPMAALRDQCLGDTKVDLAEANRRIIAALRDRTAQPIGSPSAQSPSGGAYGASRPTRETRVQAGRDESDKFIAGATKAIEIRAGLERDREVIAAERNSEFLSMSMVDVMRASLQMRGLPTGGSREDVIRRALAAGPGQGTDHFPAIMENIANKSVMDGYLSAEETWNVWTQPGTLNDYRTASRVNKSLFDKLDKMEEHEQFQHGRFADVKQSITGYLHGKEFSLTLQSIVNDDLSILTDDARAWGEAANATIGDAVFVVLSASGTGGYGQSMDEDSTILFHADHSNYIASGAGGAPAEATLQAGRTAMMTQSDPNGRTIASRPRYLLHGTTLTPTVVKLLGSSFYITGSSTTEGELNWASTIGLQSVEEYRIDSWVSTAWLLAAARRTVEVSFVGGQTTPRVDRMATSAIPGVSWQISIPFGVAALDYRTLYLNYGA